MHKVIFTLLLSLCCAVLQASEKEVNSNLFKCVDSESLVLDQSCIQNTIEKDINVQQQGFTIAGLDGELGDNIMATMSFYPDKMLIEIVAHTDAADNSLVSRVASK